MYRRSSLRIKEKLCTLEARISLMGLASREVHRWNFKCTKIIIAPVRARSACSSLAGPKKTKLPGLGAAAGGGFFGFFRDL